MALIKATDLAYGRLRSPDLDVAEEFLTNFGMVRAARTNTALYTAGDAWLTLLGGFTHFFGPLLGAFVFIYLQDFVMSIVPYWRLIFGAILAAVVILAPTGLMGLLASRRRQRAEPVSAA